MAVTAVEDLVGEPVNAVCFVEDYMELHFNGPILRALVTAVLETPSSLWRFPDPGSREAMCALIGAMVMDIGVDDTRSIQLRLDKGRVFTIPLNEPRQASGEAAHFVVPGPNGVMAVW
jgi:hypothetical protein